MAIVMGLDQHRAQITADWLNTETGEVSRARVTPAHRDRVRQFVGRFAGQDLEVALEATTGWRFVVEELQAIGGRRAPRRARRDKHPARQQEARQD
jgi:transposase